MRIDKKWLIHFNKLALTLMVLIKNQLLNSSRKAKIHFVRVIQSRLLPLRTVRLGSSARDSSWNLTPSQKPSNHKCSFNFLEFLVLLHLRQINPPQILLLITFSTPSILNPSNELQTPRTTKSNRSLSTGKLSNMRNSKAFDPLTCLTLTTSLTRISIWSCRASVL